MEYKCVLNDYPSALQKPSLEEYRNPLAAYMFIVKNRGRGTRSCMDVNSGGIFFVVNCNCLLNVATIVVWTDDVINLD